MPTKDAIKLTGTFWLTLVMTFLVGYINFKLRYLTIQYCILNTHNADKDTKDDFLCVRYRRNICACFLLSI